MCFLSLAESDAVTTGFYFSPHTKNRTHFSNQCHIFNVNLMCGARSLACDPHGERAHREPRVSLKIIRNRKHHFLLQTARLPLVIHEEEKTSRLGGKLVHREERKAFVNCFCVIVVVFVVAVAVDRVMLSRP